MIDRLDISDPRAAAILAGTTSRYILLELAGCERTLGMLKTVTGLPLSLLHYHLRRMISLELVSIVREEARAGRPVKVYRAVARSFFVPAQLVSRGANKLLTLELNAALERARALSREDGVLYSVEGGHPKMQRIADAGSEGTELWGGLFLDERDAKALAADLRRLLQLYQGPPKKGAHAYLAHLVVAKR